MFIAAPFLPLFGALMVGWIWPQIVVPTWGNTLFLALSAYGIAALLNAATGHAREIRARLQKGEAPCPQCGFDLSGLQQIGIGRTHCPECGLVTVAADELRELWRGTLIMWHLYWSSVRRQRDIERWRLRCLAEFPMYWDEFKPDEPQPPVPPSVISDASNTNEPSA